MTRRTAKTRSLSKRTLPRGGEKAMTCNVVAAKDRLSAEGPLPWSG